MGRKQTIKCPICGNENFVSFNNPINDQYASLIGNAYICPHCGYVLWIREDYPKFYKDRMEHIKEIEDEIQKSEKGIEELSTKLRDVSKNAKNLEKLKNQLKQRLELGDTGKVIRALEEMIQDEEKIISSGKNPGVQHDIDMINSKIKELQTKKEELLKPVKTRKLYN